MGLDNRLRRLERRVGLHRVPDDDGDEDDRDTPEQEAESMAILAEMVAMRRLGREPSEELAEEVAGLEVRMAAAALGLAAEGIKRLRLSDDSRLIREKMLAEYAARRRACALEPGGVV